MLAPRLLRQLPNAISTARLFATPVLAWAAATERPIAFRWLLLACLLSDILDGWIARSFDCKTKLGAQLDSSADLLLVLAAYFGMWRLQREVVAAHAAILACAAGLYLGEILLAFLRYGKPSSFHTLLVRCAAYSQGVFLVTLFFWGYSAVVFWGTVCVVILASLEELALLYLLPEWKSDVGGLHRVLRARRASQR
jgi:CDP-diacylglycerol--glycerol-3-phosphate 3-phosphatidyltransferase